VNGCASVRLGAVRDLRDRDFVMGCLELLSYLYHKNV